MKFDKKLISGWGNFPNLHGDVYKTKSVRDTIEAINSLDTLIAYGNGRSYGDSAISEVVVDSKLQSLFLDFDVETGCLEVQAGALLKDIIDVFVPRGWFLKITPGTKLVTVGGAIASDIHGKNHHNAGCFSECVESFKIVLSDGRLRNCSKKDDSELFRATCGGQGLTGIIVSAKIYLKKIESQLIDQVTIKTRNLRDTFNTFDENGDSEYSVAWIDCLAKGQNLGRSLVDLGEFRRDGDLNYVAPKRLQMPFNLPSFILNKLSVKAFNFLYYNRQTRRSRTSIVKLDSYFYPLDSIAFWNKLYGKNGFVQYQVILPIKHSYDGMHRILSKISDSGKGSFLAVLKLHGESNENYLSFPMSGYSLALDFKLESGLFKLLDELDAIVVELGGRTYLAKDSRVSKAVFEQGYPKIEEFREFRKLNNMTEKFNSLQSTRLGL